MSDLHESTAGARQRLTCAVLAIVLSVSLPTAAFARGDDNPQKQKKSTKKSPAAQASPVPASLLQAVRSTVGEATRVKSVRSPRSGVVRVVLDQPLVKEAEYRTALVGSCGEILKAKAERTARTIEIVSGDERQGYVYQPTSNCKDVIKADDDRRRMIILPQTTVFRAPR